MQAVLLAPQDVLDVVACTKDAWAASRHQPHRCDDVTEGGSDSFEL